MNAIRAVYNFLVGDMTILVGIVIVFAVLLLIRFVDVLASLRPYAGAIIIVCVLVVLGLSLQRELKP